ncbi:glycosyltransferase [Komagataeibacter sp. FXV3]|uniref:glycosyltransferase n=1 Tax=Komagataeibacter sp. FXV3 TaxID=2608998 RepID=UPI00187B12B4|nr:glycosyltransferase [Komagataeibacter sp. FXV3]MBE7731376.1 glycosyltransferase [Komagataeibacter sp. FXV3]
MKDDPKKNLDKTTYLSKELFVKSGQLQVAKEFLRDLNEELEDRNRNKILLNTRIQQLEDSARHHQAHIRNIEEQNAALKTRAHELEESMRKCQDYIRGLEEHNEFLQSEFLIYKTRLETSRNSLSWRMTVPVRWIGRQPKWVKHTVKETLSSLKNSIQTPEFFKRKNDNSQSHAEQHNHAVAEPHAEQHNHAVAEPHAEQHNHAVAQPHAEQHNHAAVVPPHGSHIHPSLEVARQIFSEQQSDLSSQDAQAALAELAHKPLISIIMPIYNTPLKWLRRAIESLQEQYYEHWELCVVDDCSPTKDQQNLLKELARTDPRIRLQVMPRNGGISAASNVALDMARGTYVALLDHDDELTPDALFRVVEAINQQPEADFIYSDECKIDDTPDRGLFDFIFKPDWSPEIMFNCMLSGHLSVYAKTLVDDIGGFRSEYDFSQDYDLALRASEKAKCIVHIERILYLWRAIAGSAAAGGKNYARETNIAALNDALQRRLIPGLATPLPHANYVRIAVPEEGARVSIIIPSDSVANLRLALQAIRNGTDYENYEVVVVCNGPLAARLQDEFFDWDKVVFVKYNKAYNFSDKCNEGARGSTGDIVVFYNDDVFPMQRDWIERLIEYLWVPGVGGVSPKLVYENDTIQYSGMISGTPGLCGTAYHTQPWDSTDLFLSMHKYVRNISLLSGACCAMRKDLFWKVGGFDSVNTPDGHSDMDLSFKLIEAGYRCVYTPYALLRHVGNHSWNAKRHKYKADIYALRRWGAYLSHDPYFTPSMQRVLYRDFQFNYRIYAEHYDSSRVVTGPDVLFVSHELTLTGAPRMLLYAAQTVLQAGGFPVVVAPQDGPLCEEIVRAGIVVIIDESITDNHFLFERFARNFDVAVVNTVAMTSVVRQLSAINILRTVWWLHEAQSLSHYLSKNQVQGIDWEQVQIVCVSDYAKSFVPENIPAMILHNGIPDNATRVANLPTRNFLIFVMSGTVEFRKGQDILVAAIALLPRHVRKQCRFIMSGKLWEWNREYWKGIETEMESLPEVSYIGILDHEAQLRLVASADVLVCPSRDDPFPLVVMEAAMLSKTSIMSNHVGTCDVFDEDSSYTFESGNALSLSMQLLWAYENRHDLKNMGKNARETFKKSLTLSAFSKNFLEIISQQIAVTYPEKTSADTRSKMPVRNSGKKEMISLLQTGE